jgi:hypothetical protein
MKRFSWLFILGILSLSRCNVLKDIEFKAAGLTGGEFRFKTAVPADFHPSDAAAVFLQNGDLLLVFKSSAPQPVQEPGKSVLQTRSQDRGRTWTHPVPAFNAAWDFRHPVIVSIPDGPILLAFSRQDADDPSQPCRDPGFFVSHSVDNGASFSAPRLVRTPKAGRSATSGSAVVLEDGSVLLPLSSGKAVRLAVSKDNGETWSIGAPVAEDPVSGFRNPSLVRLSDRRLFCLFERASRSPGLMSCESSDNGVTWSKPVDTGILGGRPSCAALSGGVLVCAFADRWPSGMSLMRSFDGGVRWEGMEQLSASDSECSIVPLDQNTVLAVCGSVESGQGAQIRTAVLSESAPGPPAGLSGSYKREKGIHLRWNSLRRAVYYAVYRDTASITEPLPDALRMATTVSPGFSDTAVDSGETYFYRITAVRSENAPAPGSEGPPSEQLKIAAAEVRK